jgi:hypothetical protein
MHLTLKRREVLEETSLSLVKITLTLNKLQYRRKFKEKKRNGRDLSNSKIFMKIRDLIFLEELEKKLIITQVCNKISKGLVDPHKA